MIAYDYTSHRGIDRLLCILGYRKMVSHFTTPFRKSGQVGRSYFLPWGSFVCSFKNSYTHTFGMRYTFPTRKHLICPLFRSWYAFALQTPSISRSWGTVTISGYSSKSRAKSVDFFFICVTS